MVTRNKFSGGSEEHGSLNVYTRMRRLILAGEWKPGERLVERRIARSFGVSRTPIRQALAMLEAEGLIGITPNRGATVRSYQAEELDDLYRLRAVLEGYAAGRAATLITSEGLSRLGESCHRFEKLRAKDDVVKLVEENLFFHDTILKAAESESLSRTLRNLVELPLLYKVYFWYSPEQKLISEHYHRQLLKAFETQDTARAERLMKEHICEAGEFLAAQIRAGSATGPTEPQVRGCANSERYPTAGNSSGV